ncbi:integrase family protein [Calothrix sp. NIES-4071]|nr:integrase family protein [Calothrix sp. NIES-4071]BAZ64213.1 integrase family protein [Calothrix sp. NIES-4105]
MNNKLEQKLQVKTELQVVLPAQIVCSKCGSDNYIKAGFKKSGKQRYRCKNCDAQFVPFANRKKLVKSDDVWTAADLGLQVKLHSNDGDKLNFNRNIYQEWLKVYIKKFIKYKASQTSSFQSLQSFLYRFRYFSKFLLNQPEINKIENITREVIINYLFYLNKESLAQITKGKCISALVSLFEVGSANKWFTVEPYLVRKEDYPKRDKALPRYIPEEVIGQLNQHLDVLPEPIMRMVLVIQECGLRIGELCQLGLDCLKQDNKGGWFIQFMRWKMNFETTLPISIELAQVIKEQQVYIQQNFGKDYKYLFCGRKASSKFVPVPRVMSDQSFANHLKRLAEQFNICESTGKTWNFQTHQFRHTVGTRMINNGVPQHIVQRYLGHESPTMTMVYAHIHDETLRKEVEKYHESKVVNFQGETTELDETILSSNDDLEWFKKNVQARALEHGYCARPKVLGDCDIPGFDGCYNCPHWRTNKNFLPILKDTLERTNNVLEKAQNCGWQLQVHKNTPIKDNLEKVIKTLEADND